MKVQRSSYSLRKRLRGISVVLGVFGLVLVARAAHLLDHHMQHQGRALSQRGGRVAGPITGCRFKGRHDGRYIG